MSGPGFITSDSVEIKNILNEENTVFLIFANPSTAQIQPLYDDALEVINNNNPTVWRVLWIKTPAQVDTDLKTLFWPEGITQGVVLSLGTGLGRELKMSYATGELTGAFDIFSAFSNG